MHDYTYTLAELRETRLLLLSTSHNLSMAVTAEDSAETATRKRKEKTRTAILVSRIESEIVNISSAKVVRALDAMNECADYLKSGCAGLRSARKEVDTVEQRLDGVTTAVALISKAVSLIA